MDMSMAIDPSTLYNSEYYKTTAQTSELQNKLTSSALSNASDDELLNVCKEFEAYFVEQIFKGMVKMLPEKEKKSANEVEMFGDMLYQDMALKATKHTDFGIAQKLYEQMKRNYGLD